MIQLHSPSGEMPAIDMSSMRGCKEYSGCSPANGEGDNSAQNKDEGRFYTYCVG